MRVKYLLIIFLLFSFSVSQAQLNVGAFGGLNISKLKGDVPDDAKYKNRMGSDFGLMIDLEITDQFTISLQPLFTQRGTKIAYTVRSELYPVDSIRIRINYFSVPLLAKIAANNKRFYAIGGLEAAFPLTANAHFVSSTGNKKDISSHISKLGLVMHFGIGYRIPLQKFNLFIEGKYLQSLNNTVSEESEEYAYIPRVRTRDFQLKFGIEIPLIK